MSFVFGWSGSRRSTWIDPDLLIHFSHSNGADDTNSANPSSYDATQERQTLKTWTRGPVGTPTQAVGLHGTKRLSIVSQSRQDIGIIKRTSIQGVYYSAVSRLQSHLPAYQSVFIQTDKPMYNILKQHLSVFNTLFAHILVFAHCSVLGENIVQRITTITDG